MSHSAATAATAAPSPAASPFRSDLTPGTTAPAAGDPSPVPAIMIVESDHILAECVARACYVADHKTHATDHESRAYDTTNHNTTAPPPLTTHIFPDAVAAIQSIDDVQPALIFLDLLLTGPDGFTLLNELTSYPETAHIPVVALSDLDLSRVDLSIYNIVGVLHKDTMTPALIKKFVQKYVKAPQDLPFYTQNAPKTSQNTRKSPQNDPKTLQNNHATSQNTPKTPQFRPAEAQK